MLFMPEDSFLVSTACQGPSSVGISTGEEQRVLGLPFLTHDLQASKEEGSPDPVPFSIESVMPSNHLILCHPLLLLPSIFASIRVFSNESGSQSIGVSGVLEFQLQHQSFQ